jgi:4-hydroxy 2-oxovalerate aldolase
MNKNTFEILDCTIRDGGYYTDWNFSDDFIEDYLNACAKSPISIIELGYISRANDTNGPYYHLNKNLIKRAKKILGHKKKIFVMINFKEIDSYSSLNKLLKDKVNYIDGVRFAVAPKDVKKLSNIVQKISKKYKKISYNLNLMYLSEWFNNLKMIKNIFNNITKEIKRVSFVDSYGALTPTDISEFMKKINLLNIKQFDLGCHFHNNCGLALANSIVANKNGCKIIDTTFAGMGRGAGNAETELLISIFPQTRTKIIDFSLNNFLERLDKLKSKMKWGSSFAYAFAAKNGYSQAEMMDLIQKRRLDPSTAIEVISNKKKTNKINFKNLKTLSNIKKNKNISILIGGAKSFIQHGKQLLRSVNNNSPIFFSGSSSINNFIKLKIKIKNPTYLILTGNEIKKIEKKFKNFNLKGIIAEEKFIPKNFKKKNSIIYSDTIAENPLSLLGKLFIKIKLKKLSLAFFDGNIENEKQKILFNETQNSINQLIKQNLNITTITKSSYNLKYVNPWLN